ncbi:MAG: enoyl-ACP reductase [Planctomycetes bacterium]|nr:enoyl-ACP reductase [Planctomycetota bacterium]
MALLSGKNVVIFGVANKRSIAWGIAQALHQEGARIALTYQNERMSDSVTRLAAELGEDTIVVPCDVTVEGDVNRCFESIGTQFDGLDGLVHSIAFAKREELGGKFVDTSWEGYALAQKVSAWSLIDLCRAATPLMAGREASVICLSYYGAEKVVTNYNVMGIAKAALEANTRYLANDLGPSGIRVNAISAGPIKTVSAMGVADFGSMLKEIALRAPLRRNVDQADVGNTATFLLSPLSTGITGQVIHVDAGYSILGV